MCPQSYEIILINANKKRTKVQKSEILSRNTHFEGERRLKIRNCSATIWRVGSTPQNKEAGSGLKRRSLVYGRSFAPRYSFRSNCQVKAILHPVRRYPNALRRRGAARAVLCSHLFLGLGSPRVLRSECHSRHSFTHNCSTHRFPRYCISRKSAAH